MPEQFDLKDFYDILPVALWRTTLDGEFLSANKYCVKLLGYRSFNELKKKARASDFYFSMEDRDSLINQAKDCDGVYETEIKIVTKSNKELIIWAAVRVHEDQGYMEGVFIDITDKKMADTICNIKAAALNKLKELSA